MPVAVVALVMIGATPAAATVIESVALPVPVALVALRVKIETPAVVGVPVIAPVAATMLKPAGKGLAV